MSCRAPLVALLALLPAARAALPVPDPTAPGELTLLDPAALEPRWNQPAELRDALARRDHSATVTAIQKVPVSSLSGRAVTDRAFVLAWALVRADRAAEAVHLIEELRVADGAPTAYLQLVLGELLLADGRYPEAAAALASVPATSRIAPRATLKAAEAYQKAGATQHAGELYQSLADRSDPSDGTDLALMALAQRAGIGSPAAYPHLRRVWSRYPRSASNSRATRELAAYEAKGAQYKPSDDDVAWRAEALMEHNRFEDAVTLITSEAGRWAKVSPAACNAWYTQGRSQFKRNNVTAAADVLTAAAARCKTIDPDRTAKGLYVAGKALERKKDWAGAAAAYGQIPDVAPEHSMADDGYALAGIALQIAGDAAGAEALWTQQVTRYPKGDLAAEGFWRLAWTRYLDGDPAGAIAWAEKSVWEARIGDDPVHAMAARYWAARWRIYPDVASPSTKSSDPVAVARGIEQLLALCREHPTSFYALMAAQRLYELAPAALLAIPRDEKRLVDGAWTVRSRWTREPAVADALLLARLGLVGEALAELDTLDPDHLLPSEMAITTGIEARKDPIAAHDHMHKYLLSHPPSTLGADRDRILAVAYPDTWWDEVQKANADYSWDPRVFHALVREESSFNPKIVSWAGARGLSQLMPATARQVAGWLGRSVTTSQLDDPQTNLDIGARYLESLIDTYDGNLFLAIPSYNAGPGNVNSWLKAAGPGPTDEFVERIPIRETRGYVKRVLGTWQIYRTTFDPGVQYADLSRFNHLARPPAK